MNRETPADWLNLTVKALLQATASGRFQPMLDFSALQTQFSHRHGHTQPDWEQRAMRWGTVNLTHGDAPDFDARFWLDYAKTSHLDAVSWSSGGIWATYPTQIEHHPTLRGLQGDPLGELVDGARELGLIVTARVDHHAVTSEIAAQNPQWLARDANGEARPHWAAPDLFITCALGPYNEQQMTAILREVAARYGVDGFNHNRWAPQGMCYCESCRAQFYAFCGEELPLTGEENAPDRAAFSLGDGRDEGWKTYFVWRETRLLELWDIWNAAVQGINPLAFILPGIGAEAGKMSLAKLRCRAKTLYLDYQGRSGNNAPWSCGRGVKEVRAALGEDKPTGITFTVGVEYGWPRWKDSSQSSAELRVWLAEAFANNARPKWAKFDGRVRDARWMPCVAQIYGWAAQNQRYLHPVRSLANTALLVSPSSARFGPPSDYDRASRGWHQALLEARLPFDCVHEEFLDELDPQRYQLLIVPDASCLSDAALENLENYVESGGNLIATHRSAMCDELGRPRSRWGLGELLGLEARGHEERLVNSYALIDRASQHPLLGELETDATRPIGATSRVVIAPLRADFASSPLLFVPPYPDLPMEEVFPRQEASEPLFWSRETSNGARLGYFSANFDAAFWDYLCADHRDFLVGAAKWALRDAVPSQVRGAGFLDVTLQRGADFLALHVVNMTNPFALRGPMRELFPVGPLQIEIVLPSGFAPRRVHLLRAAKEIEFQVEDGVLHAVIERVEEHECLICE